MGQKGRFFLTHFSHVFIEGDETLIKGTAARKINCAQSFFDVVETVFLASGHGITLRIFLGKRLLFFKKNAILNPD